MTTFEFTYTWDFPVYVQGLQGLEYITSREFMDMNYSHNSEILLKSF